MMRAVARAATIALLVLVLIPAVPAAALDLGEWVRGLTLSPFVSERVEYQTNVFQTSHDAQADVIFKTIPGILAEWRAAPLTVSAGYRTEILRFLERPSQDKEHHIAVGQVRYEGPRLQVDFRDDFTKTSDPPGSELTGRIESTTNVLAPDVEYRFVERLSAGLNYAWTRVDFEQTVDQLDRDEHLLGGSVYWKFLPKTDIRIGYAYGIKTFASDTTRDVSRHIATVGLRGEVTAKLSSTFRMGYEHREPEGSGQKAFTGLVTGGDWTYKPTERTTISLLTERSTQESTFQSSPFFVSTTAALIAAHQLMPKLSVDARLTIGLNDYPTKATVDGETRFREDWLFGWGAGIDYEIQKWLRVGAEYSHTRRHSNFDSFNFKDDKITARATLQF
jgi:hypothetical protein